MNNPFNFFDKIYCINLKEREDRWTECLNNFKKYEINNYERIEGVKINGNLPLKRKGQIGCALSFVNCFNDTLKNNYNNILLLEDDFDFRLEKNELFAKINVSINELPSDWDSLYFGGTVVSDYGFLPIKKYSNNLYKLNSAHCLHCAAFSANGIKKILQFFNNKNEWHLDLINNYENMDVFMAKEFQNKTNSFITSELLCYQKVNRSNIENEVYDYNEWMNRNFNYFKTII